MSTSNTHQKSLVDSGSETRPLMLERGSYIPLASHFRRYLNQKRENKKWLNKAIDEGPYVFKDFTPPDSQSPRLQTEDDLKHYEAEIEKLVNASRVKKLEKSHDPLALVAHTGSSSRTPSPYYVTNPSFVDDYDNDYQGGAFQNNFEYPPTSAMMLLARAITQRYSNPTNNRLRTSSNTKNQAIVQADRVNIQSRNSGNDGRDTRRSYVQKEIIKGNNKGHYARNCPKLKVRDSKYFMEQMLLAKQDEAGVTLTDEHNDFIVADVTRREEIKELSANICLMARIQPTNIDSNAGPSYDSAFLSEQPKIINDTIGDDQINSNIIFDEQNVDVNSDRVEYDINVQASYELEQLARNAYKEAEKQEINANKVKQQNKVLTQQLELYKEKVRFFEMTKGNNTNFFNEFIKADRKARRLEKDLQT
ncbi:hypothetical protein Tco_0179473 [Tanacetum coccineum]